MIANLSEIGDGRLVKMEVDYSETVDRVIPEAQAKAKAGKLSEALDALFVMEKQTRLAADMRSNSRIQLAIVQLCFQEGNWNELNESIVALTKKRSLIKGAVSKMIQECCTYVDKAPSVEQSRKLIETLRTVTVGKIYVEVERARLTYKLAKMNEADNNLEEACKIMLELQIETYGSMERQEKVELLLEQMRLCLARKDFLRSQIISKKISVKFFEEPSIEVEKLKLKFYQLMIVLDQHESNYLEICRHYFAAYNTPIVQNDLERLQEALKNVVLYLLLAAHDNEQSDLLGRIKQDKNLDKIPLYKELLGLFSVQEIIDWQRDVVAKYQTALMQGTPGNPPTGVFDSKTEVGQKHWTDLQTRVVEHNIRMIAKYYSRIRISRMSQLLHWSDKKTEEFLCQLVTNGTIPGAKINRLAGIVQFHPRKSPTEALDDWSTNVRSVMDLLNKASHLIVKEEMVHRHLHVGGAATASHS